ncbi:hypothetical protein UCRPC4_g05470 [Phaeomoniella chlamydospora]|uniref:Uncharacterized protein n=1 Tax=Phaeomoniella chlamydospora TaxID=158046 RepID=A0A0G2E4B0_PHACM|nr:hypothetical protein UCRPC4_g05470 [Phaeomoniella chlamydospora]
MLLSTAALLLPSLFALSASAASPLPFITHLSYSPVSDSSNPQPLATISYDPARFTTDLQSWTPPNSLAEPLDSETNRPLVKVLTESGTSTLTSIGVFNETLISDDGPGITIKLALDPEGNVFNAFVTSAVAPPGTKKISKTTPDGKPKSKARLEREAREAAREAKAAAQAASRSAKKAASTAAMQPVTTTTVITSTSTAFPKIQVQLLPSVPGPFPKLAPPRAPKLAADGSQLPAGAQGDDDEQKVEKTFLQKYWWIILLISVFALTGGGDK